MRSERDLVGRLRSHFESSGYAVFTEVNFLLRRIDLVCLHESSGEVVSVEAKLRDWRRAVEQAKTCLLCSDEVLIAVPEELNARVDMARLQEWGIGLIIVGEGVAKVLDGVRGALMDPVHKSEVIAHLRGHTA
jgi:hypothetical protein